MTHLVLLSPLVSVLVQLAHLFRQLLNLGLEQNIANLFSPSSQIRVNEVCILARESCREHYISIQYKLLK